MNKKWVIFCVALILLIFAFNSFALANQNFDGKFSMEVPFGNHYSDVAYCLPNGGLGSAAEYWEDDAGCDIEDNDIVVYYYNNSLLVDGEANAMQHALNGLTTSYLYQIYQNGDVIILTNDLGMNALPPYLAGVCSDDASEAVFVGGTNLDDVKYYAQSVEFFN